MNKDVSSSQNSTNVPIEVPDSEPLDNDIQIINNQDNCVTLDDDSDVIIEENHPVIVDIDSDDLEIIENNNTPIVIEDEDQNCVINPLNLVQKKQDQLLDKVCQENSLLAQVIEDAMNLDSSGSMKRIIQRTLVPLYLDCRTSFKESEFLKNSLKRTTILLETAPHLKYSHIKSLCESLKYSKLKITVPRPRQQTNGSSPKKRKHKPKKRRKHKKRKKDTATVDRTQSKKNKANTDSTIPKETNTTNKNTMIEIEIPAMTSVSPTSDKENIVTDNIQTTNDKLNKASMETTHNNVNNNTAVETNSLLTPHYAIATMPTETAQQTVQSLETEIAKLKKELERIEEQEIMDDNTLSPYIIADTLKSKIVKLYQQLCDLMGAESTKRHEVKLQVLNGHPPGPARCLEEYINENIDEYGNPPFPDIFEVVRCVKRAVEEDRLPWNRKQIVAEAQVLLKHYGHAIQKRRKKREWRDMVSRCKEELVDPADMDPALEAKLQQNSRIARRNEDEVLDRYARLEKENDTNPAFRLSLETSMDGSDSEDNEDIHGPSHNNKPVENNLQESSRFIMADSTTNLENCPSTVNLNTEINIQTASNTMRNVLEINPQSCSSIINSINVLNSTSKNIGESNAGNTSLRNSTTQNGTILLLNSPNSSIPNLHGSICFINSTPVFATRIQGSPNFINSTNNLEGNLQNTPNNLAGNQQNPPNNLLSNLQNAPYFINSNNLTGNPQNSFINSNNLCNRQTGPSFIDSFINSLNNLAGNQQNGNLFTNISNNLAGNQQNGSRFTNTSNNLAGNKQSGHNFINSNNLELILQNSPNIISTSNNLESNLQCAPSLINSSSNLDGNLQSKPNNLEGNLQSGPNNLEGNQQSHPRSITNNADNIEGNLHSCPIDSTTDSKTQSIVTNIGNVEYNRTIMMDSNESDTDNDRKDNIDIVTDTNTIKERDKSFIDTDKERANDIDEKEYKIKVKQEEDDVIKLLSELGSDCVGTVFDIEDHFLVIEISDSSDDE